LHNTEVNDAVTVNSIPTNNGNVILHRMARVQHHNMANNIYYNWVSKSLMLLLIQKRWKNFKQQTNQHQRIKQCQLKWLVTNSFQHFVVGEKVHKKVSD
jgi:hypothetical protein